MKTKAIDKSAIQWTGPTWNPWQGCRKVSAGCANCYMFTEKKRYGQNPDVVVRSTPATFNKPLKWQKEMERGLRTGQDRLVFTCSWSDWFIQEADACRPEAWEIVRRCPGLIFQILTKRTEWINAMPRGVLGGDQGLLLARLTRRHPMRDRDGGPNSLRLWIPAVLFLSLEPLLGPIDLTQNKPDCGLPAIRKLPDAINEPKPSKGLLGHRRR